MPKSEELWFGPVTNEKMAELEKCNGREFAKARTLRAGSNESWVALDSPTHEWPSLRVRHHEFDVSGNFADAQRYEASKRLQELAWRGFETDFGNEFGAGVLKGSRSAWRSRCVQHDGSYQVEFEKRFATPFEADSEFLKSLVRKIEEEYNVIVYHVIWEMHKRVELYELLFVSPCVENWVRERDSIACGWADAFVVSPAEPDEEVMAKIGIEVAEGCLLRRWPEEHGPAAKRAAAVIGKIGQRAVSAVERLRQQP